MTESLKKGPGKPRVEDVGREVSILDTGIQGAKDAFDKEELVSILPNLFTYAMKIRRGNDTEAKDLVQETVLKALRHRDKFEAGTNLRAWLFKILQNANVDLYCDAYARRVVRGEEGETLLGGVKDGRHDEGMGLDCITSDTYCTP